MPSQALEQMLISVPSIGQDKTYQTIDTYTAGTMALYSGKPLDKPLNVSKPLNKPYGQHENKLIDNKGLTTVYSNFQKNNLKLDTFNNDLGKSHKEKNKLLDINLPYKDMFNK